MGEAMDSGTPPADETVKLPSLGPWTLAGNSERQHHCRARNGGVKPRSKPARAFLGRRLDLLKVANSDKFATKLHLAWHSDSKRRRDNTGSRSSFFPGKAGRRGTSDHYQARPEAAA